MRKQFLIPNEPFTSVHLRVWPAGSSVAIHCCWSCRILAVSQTYRVQIAAHEASQVPQLSLMNSTGSFYDSIHLGCVPQSSAEQENPPSRLLRFLGWDPGHQHLSSFPGSSQVENGWARTTC